MSHKRLLVAATIIACVILAGFALSVPHTRDIVEKTSPQPATTPTPSVALHDAFRRGTHTITGSVEAPTPCTSLSASATTTGTASSTTGILVAVLMPADTGICLQQSTVLDFSATVAAPANLPITATVNGITATTTAL